MVCPIDATHDPNAAQLALWRQRNANRTNGRMYMQGYTDGMAAYQGDDADQLAYGLRYYRRQARITFECMYEMGIYQALLARVRGEAF